MEIGSAVYIIIMKTVMKIIWRVDIMSSLGANLKNWTQKSG